MLAAMPRPGVLMQAGGMAPTCMIVDDSRAFLQAARDLLESEGITVVGVASTGAEASRQCRELGPDVVLVDIDLGSESGFDVARDLSGGQGNGCPYVILISAYSGEDFADLIAESPALAFLRKPDLSAAAIRGILAGAGQPKRTS
jgi:CheY-like chemotaxis protein